MIPSKAPPEGTNTTGPNVQRRPEEQPREGRSSALSGVGNSSTSGAALKAERYYPKIFGFKINEIAKLQRWQGAMRDRCVIAAVLLPNHTLTTHR